MDRISLLPDDLIFKILSYVPTKVSVTTSLLSKRWYSIWKHIPYLKYSDPHRDSEYWRASRFIDKFLLLRDNTHALETMHLYVSKHCHHTDIETWVGIAVSRGVRDFMFHQCRPCYQPIRLPSSLYTCETLVTLTLHHAIIVDVPLNICFRSLKSLSLLVADFPSDETVDRFLSGCHVLEDLTVVRCVHEKVKTFRIMVPSLQRLTIYSIIQHGKPAPGDDVGFVIKTPCLKSLAITSKFGWFHSLVKMPYLVKANIMLQLGDAKDLLGCVTSAKHLVLCMQKSVDSHPIGDFNQLVSLEVCTCSLEWYHLILSRAPKLRVLRFKGEPNVLPTPLERPSSVPECLVSSLETVEWIDYKGTEAEREEVMYLVDNSGGQLKKVTVIISESTTTKGQTFKIL